MDSIDFKNMSNEDIKLKLKEIENEYESSKAKALKLFDRMRELDDLFLSGKKELVNRSKGIF